MSSRTYLVAGVLIAALLAGAARASAPDAAGVIHTCFKAQSGQVRVTDGDDGVPPACEDSELALAWNLTGPAGQPGAQGEQGPSGEDGLAGAPGRIITDIESRLTTFYASETKSMEIDCPAGTQVIGGGGNGGEAPQGGADITQSAPLTTGEGWYVEARRDDAVPPQMIWELVGFAMCAFVGP